MYGNIIKESYIIKWYRKHSYQKKKHVSAVNQYT